MSGRLLSRTLSTGIRGVAAIRHPSLGSAMGLCPVSSQSLRWKSHYSSDILLETQQAGVRRLVLNNEPKRNALSYAMLERLAEAFSPAEDPAKDDKLSCVVISAKGRVFSSGHDLKELQKKNETAPSARELFELCSYVMMAIQRFHVPVIAEVSGLATAAGCQLVASCDMVIAGESARFATPGVNIGLFCTTPSVPVIRTIPEKQAMYMLFTGEPMSAHDAWVHGLVSKIVPDDELQAATKSLTTHLTALSRDVLKLGKEAVLSHMDSPTIGAAYENASQYMTRNVSMNDCQEGIDAFFDKRRPNWNTESGSPKSKKD